MANDTLPPQTLAPPHARSAGDEPAAHAPHRPLRMEFAVCCLCGVDDSTPIAVGEDFEYRTAPDEFLAVKCRRCGLIYLNPRPAEDEAPRIYPDHYHAFDFNPAEFGFVYRVRRRLEARRLLRWSRGLPKEARILDVGCGDGFHLELLRSFGRPGWQLEGIDIDPRAQQGARERGLVVRQGDVASRELQPASYDMILLIMTVEHLPDPLAKLRRVAELLAPGGRVVIVTDNAGSPDFKIFGGRHWGGYHFPRHTYLFNKPALRRLAAAAHLDVKRLTTGTSPVNWVYSLRNLLDDWGAPRWMLPFFSLKSAPALAVFTAWDWLLSLVGRGAVLHAVLRKPLTTEAPQ